jgi:hypothetical protein
MPLKSRTFCLARAIFLAGTVLQYISSLKIVGLRTLSDKNFFRIWRITDYQMTKLSRKKKLERSLASRKQSHNAGYKMRTNICSHLTRYVRNLSRTVT